MFAHGETVTVLTAGLEEDPYSGEFVPSWEWMPSGVEVPGVGIEPRPSSEPTQEARNSVVGGFTLYFPPGTVVSPENRVVVRGKTYSVMGEAASWRNPFTGWDAGVVVQVEAVEG